MSHSNVHITIHFGDTHFSEKTDGDPTVGGIKLEAITSFDLPLADADKYVVTRSGVELDDAKHIASFGKSELHWKLERRDNDKFDSSVKSPRRRNP